MSSLFQQDLDPHNIILNIILFGLQSHHMHFFLIVCHIISLSCIGLIIAAITIVVFKFKSVLAFQKKENNLEQSKNMCDEEPTRLARSLKPRAAGRSKEIDSRRNKQHRGVDEIKALEAVHSCTVKKDGLIFMQMFKYA